MASYSQTFLKLSKEIFRLYEQILKAWVSRGRETKKFQGYKKIDGKSVPITIETNEPVSEAEFNRELKKQLEIRIKGNESIEDVIDRISSDVKTKIAIDLSDMHWEVANASIEKLIDDLLMDDRVINKIPLSEDLLNPRFWMEGEEEPELNPNMSMRTIAGTFSRAFHTPEGNIDKLALKEYLMQVVPSNPSYWFRWAKQTVGVKELDEWYYG